MANPDPKERAREIIESVFQQVPRTRSKKGWYIDSSKKLLFVSDIAKGICGKHEIAVIDTSLDLVGIIRNTLLHHKYMNDQHRAEAIVSNLVANSEPSVEAIVVEGMDKYTNSYFSSRYFSDDINKAKFVDHIIYSISASNGAIRVNSVENFVSLIFPFLKTCTNIQNRAEAIARALSVP